MHGRPDRQEDTEMCERMDWWEDKCEKGRNIEYEKNQWGDVGRKANYYM